MIPTAINDEAVEHYQSQGEVRVVTFHAPSGHEEDTGPAQGLVMLGVEGQSYGHQISFRLRLDDDEITRLQSGEDIWLTFATDRVIPFAGSVGTIPPVV